MNRRPSFFQTYSSLPYGTVPYHLTTNLAIIANPISCGLAGALPLKDLRGLLAITAAGLVCAAYILALAIQSPHPPLVGTMAGAAVMVNLSITSVVFA